MRYKNEETGVGVLICIWILVIISCLLVFKNSNEIIGIYILLGFGGIMTLIFIPSMLNTLKFKKECKNIVLNGMKVQGRIVNYSFTSHRIGDNHIRDYNVLVAYIDPYTGCEKQITTPPLSFNPVSSLGESSCSVYILNDLYYVTDFVPRKKGQTNIWGNEIDILKKQELKKMTICTSIFLIIFILICLCCMGIIKF